MSFWKYQPNDSRSKSLDGAGALGAGKAIPFNEYEKVNALVVFSAGVTAGVVKIESAHDPAYAGTWNQLGADVTFTADAAKGVNADFPPGGWVRARISTALVGGTVTVFLNGYRNET